METEKIGSLGYKGFKTEFRIMKKTKEFIENEDVSLGLLIPGAHTFYEQFLFDSIYGDVGEKSEKEVKRIGKNFVVVYNKITESQGWTKEKGLETTGFEENFKTNKKIIVYSGLGLSSVKNPNKNFIVNYFVTKK